MVVSAPQEAHRELNSSVARNPDLQTRLTTVTAWLRAEQIRRSLLPPAMVGVSEWNVLFDLYLNDLNDRPVPVSSACYAAAVPMTTALRGIDRLVQLEMVKRMPDRSDRRRIVLVLTDKGRTVVEAALDRVIESDRKLGLARMEQQPSN